jgi:hypothetical protein
MVVPATVDEFRDMVSALRSLDRREGVSLHTFTLPEDRCVRLLVKNLGRVMPESDIREELESLNIRVQRVMQLRSGHRDQDPTKDRPPTPTSLSRWRVGLRCKTTFTHRTLRIASVGGVVRCPQKAHCYAGTASADTRSITADTRRGASHVTAPTSPVGALARENSLSAVAAGETTLRTIGAV